MLSVLIRAEDVDLTFVADYLMKFNAICTRSLMSTMLSLFTFATEFHLGWPGLEANAAHATARS